MALWSLFHFPRNDLKPVLLFPITGAPVVGSIYVNFSKGADGTVFAGHNFLEGEFLLKVLQQPSTTPHDLVSSPGTVS